MRGVARVYPDRTLRMTMLGIGFVWFLGAFMQMVLVPFGLDDLGQTEGGSARLYTFLAVGIALGALAAGRLSGDKVEPGLVPIGSIGMGVFILLLSTSAPSFLSAGLSLGLFGIVAWLVRGAVERAPPAARGRARKGPADGDEQRRQHPRRPAGGGDGVRAHQMGRTSPARSSSSSSGRSRWWRRSSS